MQLVTDIYNLPVPIVVWDRSLKEFFRQTAVYYVTLAETIEDEESQNLPVRKLGRFITPPVQRPIDEWGGVHEGDFKKDFIRTVKIGEGVSCFHPAVLDAFNAEPSKFLGAYGSVVAKLGALGVRVEAKHQTTLSLIVEGKKDASGRLRFSGDVEKGLPYEAVYEKEDYSEEKLASDAIQYFSRFFTVFPVPEDVIVEFWFNNGRGKEYDFMSNVCDILHNDTSLPFHFIKRKAETLKFEK